MLTHYSPPDVRPKLSLSLVWAVPFSAVAISTKAIDVVQPSDQATIRRRRRDACSLQLPDITACGGPEGDALDLAPNECDYQAWFAL